ncbi:hypothetical protein [Bryobacter aggregatus]|uniref:hypothetical protein n=1 Tax=Bryobacter aggregatus TaxID=360054 RepID=UPI0012BB0A13|nr:hypothetical protein [Bryobacter aggregatus]
MAKSRQFNMVMDEHQLDIARQAARTKGFDSLSAYIRDLLDKDTRAASQHERLEATVAASIDRVAKEMRRLHNANQALFALTDSLVKLFLTCTPEPPAESLDATKRRAKLRYDRFLLSVAQNMSGAVLDILRADDNAG